METETDSGSTDLDPEIFDSTDELYQFEIHDKSGVNWQSIGASVAANIVAGVAIAAATAGGQLAWKKIEERRIARRVKKEARLNEALAERTSPDRQ